MMKRYKIIDVFGNLKSVYRPIQMMQYYVDIGLAMEELPDYDGWKRCYKGCREGGKIAVEPNSWDTDKMMEAYAPLILAYQKISSGMVMRR